MGTLSKTMLAVGLLGLSINAHAVLWNGSGMTIGAGSYFEMEVAPGQFVTTSLIGANGLITGTTQIASGSHTGLPDGTENPNVDQPWGFFGNTGMHTTTSPSTVLSSSGNTATIDFSGWRMDWRGYTTPLGTGAWDGNPDGVALVTCVGDCIWDAPYTLHYSATVPLSDASGFGGVRYRLILQGCANKTPESTCVSTIPVPAAVWLLGSGLVGLIGFSRRKARSH